MVDRIRADLTENSFGIALYDIELRDGSVGVDEKFNDDSIDADLVNTLLYF